MRDFSSPAALLVNVMAHTRSMPSTAPLSIACTTRLVNVNVLPEPAPAATTSERSSVSMHFLCPGFKAMVLCTSLRANRDRAVPASIGVDGIGMDDALLHRIYGPLDKEFCLVEHVRERQRRIIAGFRGFGRN